MTTDYLRCLFDVRDHEYFRRLKCINQLGNLELILTTKFQSYSRHEHSLGCENIARIISNRLIEQTRNRTNDDPRKVTKAHSTVLRIAALLHDVGHGALSHALDRYLRAVSNNSNHETRSVQLMRFIIEDVWNDTWQAVFPQGMVCLVSQVRALITGQHHRNLPLCFEGILNSSSVDQLDIDRLDYIPRDARLIFPEATQDILKQLAIGANMSVYVAFDGTKLIWNDPAVEFLLKVRKWLYEYGR